MKHSLSASHFRVVFDESKSLQAGDLLFKYKKGSSTPKLGLIVSKKYGNAVKRNLLKRHCRSAFKNIVFSNNSFVFSIIVRPLSKNICYKSILNSFFALNEKISN